MTKITLFFLSVFLFILGVYIYLFTDVFSIKPISKQNGLEIGFNQSFEIEFPYSVNSSFYKQNVVLEPKTGMKAIINKEHNKIILVPNNFWKENTEYKVILPKGRAVNFMPIEESSFSFKTPKYPDVISFFPENNKKDVIINKDSPIVVNFDKSTEDFFVDFAIFPKVEVDYVQSAEKNGFKILPKENLKEGVEYKVEVKIKPKNATDNFYKKVSNVSFTTYLTPREKTWAEKLQDRLDYARLNTQPQIIEGKYIDIDLNNQVMVIFENGQNFGTFLISSGKWGMNTPRGRFYVLNKKPRPWSAKYKLYMPYWLGITNSGHGIHELPEWPNGYKEGENHLGIAVSHGCVRLGVGNARRVYEWAEVGIPVIVH